jgi:hypothetical protein
MNGVLAMASVIERTRREIRQPEHVIGSVPPGGAGGGARGLFVPSKFMAHLRRIGPRTRSQLIEAVGDICDLFSADACRTVFKAAGYVA